MTANRASARLSIDEAKETKMVRPKSTLKLGRANLAPLEPNYSTINLNNEKTVRGMQDGSTRLPEMEYGVSSSLQFDPQSYRRKLMHQNKNMIQAQLIPELPKHKKETARDWPGVISILHTEGEPSQCSTPSISSGILQSRQLEPLRPPSRSISKPL